MLHVHAFLAAPLGARRVAKSGADQHQGRVPVRERPHHARPPTDLSVQPLDSMPYSGAILMLLPMCRMKLKEIYPPMFITTVIATTCGTIAVIVMCALFPGLC